LIGIKGLRIIVETSSTADTIVPLHLFSIVLVNTMLVCRVVLGSEIQGESTSKKGGAGLCQLKDKIALSQYSVGQAYCGHRTVER
jgi:hypothetical protein